MKQCPFCAENIQDAGIVCKHCGRDLVRKNSSSSVLWWRAYAWGVISAVIGLVVVQFTPTVFKRLSPRDGELYSRPRIVPTEDRLRRAIKAKGLSCLDGSASMKLAGRIGENSVLMFDCPVGVVGNLFMTADRYVITIDANGKVLLIRQTGGGPESIPKPIS